MRTGPGGFDLSLLAVFTFSAGSVVIAGQLAAWVTAFVIPEAAAPVAVAVQAVLVSVIAVAAYARWGRGASASEPVAAALWQAVPDPVAAIDRDATVIYANPAAAELFADRTPLEGRALLASVDHEGEAAARLREAARSRGASTFEAALAGRRLRFTVTPLGESAAGALAVHAADITAAERAAALVGIVAALDRRQPATQEEAAEAVRLACQELVAALGLRLAWVGRRQPGGAVGLIAGTGRPLDVAAWRWDDSPAGRSPVGEALRSGKRQVATVTEAGVQDWQKAARGHDMRSVTALPLQIDGAVAGVLVLGARRPDAFDDPDVLAMAGAVAARLAAMLALVAERERLRLMEAGLTASSSAIFVADASGSIEWANPTFARISGYAPQEILGRNPRFLKSGDHGAETYQELWQTILAGRTWSGELVNRRKDGSTYVAQETILPLAEHGGCRRFIAVQEDLTASRELEERLRRMAQYDSLTELPNRALFLDRLGHGIAVARRNHQSLALLVLNLDRFRLVNDSFGLTAGDALLKAVAVRLRQAVRASDTVARLAGDEFAVVAPQVLVREDAARVAQKLTEALQPPFDVDGQDLHVGASIGIAVFPQDGEEPEPLLARADTALRLVKGQGGNAYKFGSAA